MDSWVRCFWPDYLLKSDMVAYRFKAAGWGLRQAYFWVTALGLAIIALHFHGLLASSLNDVVWGISISLDPLGDVYLFHRLLTQVGNGCIGKR